MPGPGVHAEGYTDPLCRVESYLMCAEGSNLICVAIYIVGILFLSYMISIETIISLVMFVYQILYVLCIYKNQLRTITVQLVHIYKSTVHTRPIAVLSKPSGIIVHPGKP